MGTDHGYAMNTNAIRPMLLVTVNRGLSPIILLSFFSSVPYYDLLLC